MVVTYFRLRHWAITQAISSRQAEALVLGNLGGAYYYLEQYGTIQGGDHSFESAVGDHAQLSDQATSKTVLRRLTFLRKIEYSPSEKPSKITSTALRIPVNSTSKKAQSYLVAQSRQTVQRGFISLISEEVWRVTTPCSVVTAMVSISSTSEEVWSTHSHLRI